MLPSRFKTRPNSLLKLSAMSLVVATLSGCGEDAKDCGGFWDKTFGREECAVTPSSPAPANNNNVVAPKITAVSPMQATVGVSTTFTVTGENLTDAVQVALPDCDGLAVNSRSATQIIFTCKPNSISSQKFVVSYNGANIFSMDINASASTSDNTLLTGIFIDSPVSGLDFETDSIKGVTDKNGTFYYRAGEAVNFSLGNQEVGRVVGSGKIHVYDLNSGSADLKYEKARKVAQLLQSLDSDNNPSNNITIDSAVRDYFLKLDTPISYHVTDNVYEQALADKLKPLKKTVVSALQAQQHLQSTIDKPLNEYPEFTGNMANVQSGFPVINNGVLGDNRPVVYLPKTIGGDYFATQYYYIYNAKVNPLISSKIKSAFTGVDVGVHDGSQEGLDENVFRKIAKNAFDTTVDTVDGVANGVEIQGTANPKEAIGLILKGSSLVLKPFVGLIDTLVGYKDKSYEEKLDTAKIILDVIGDNGACIFGNTKSSKAFDNCVDGITATIEAAGYTDLYNALNVKKEDFKTLLKDTANIIKDSTGQTSPAGVAKFAGSTIELAVDLAARSADTEGKKFFYDSIVKGAFIPILKAGDCVTLTQSNLADQFADCMDNVIFPAIFDQVIKTGIRFNATRDIQKNLQQVYEYDVANMMLQDVFIYDGIYHPTNFLTNKWGYSDTSKSGMLWDDAFIRKVIKILLTEKQKSKSIWSRSFDVATFSPSNSDAAVDNVLYIYRNYLNMVIALSKDYSSKAFQVSLSVADNPNGLAINGVVNFNYELSDVGGGSLKCFIDDQEESSKSVTFDIRPTNLKRDIPFVLTPSKSGVYDVVCDAQSKDGFLGRKRLNAIVSDQVYQITWEKDKSVVRVGEPVSFDVTGNGKTMLVKWQFGNDATAYIASPTEDVSYTFTSSGKQTVIATAIDVFGRTFMYQADIDVIAGSITPNKTNIVAGDEVSFTLDTAIDAIASVVWKVGDGIISVFTSIADAFKHLFDTVGEFTVSATLKDAKDQELATVSTQVSVVCSTGQIEQNGKCIDSTTEPQPYVSWNFDNGSVQDDQKLFFSTVKGNVALENGVATFNGGYISVDAPLFMNNECNATIVSRVKYSASNTLQEIISSGDTRSNFDPITMQVANGALLDFTFEDTQQGKYVRPIFDTTKNSVVSGQWVTITLRLKNVDASSAQMDAFIDGKSVGTVNIPSSYCISYDRDMPLLIGGNEDGSANKESWQGAIDFVKVYKKALTDAQIQKMTSEGNTGTFTVPANSETGVAFTSPSSTKPLQCSFTATGLTSEAGNVPNRDANGYGSGYSNFPMPTAPIMSLVAKRGTGAYELFGKQKSADILPNEQLTFITNDTPHSNNNGQFDVTYTCSEISQPTWTPNPANGHQYAAVDCGTWTQCEAQAVALGAHLVTVNDAAENAWLVSTFTPTKNYWIGLTDKDQEGVWKWTSGETFGYGNWVTGEPNNGYGGTANESYVHMNFNYPSRTNVIGKWNDTQNDITGTGIGGIPYNSSAMGIFEKSSGITATISASSTAPVAGTAVTFSLIDTVVDGIKSVVWKVGDTVVKVLASIADAFEYIFDKSGEYTITASLKDAGDQVVLAPSLSVQVASQPPVASLVGSSMTSTVGQSVNFVLSGSKANEGKLCSYLFDNGQGLDAGGSIDCTDTNQTLPLNTINMQYTAIGTYTAKLTVTDSQGKSATTTWLVNVGEAPQIADTGKLNDTGITQCANDTALFADCSAASLGGWFGLNQDGEVGRDALASKGLLTKVGGGDAGFDFTKISATGQKLPANATEWSCVLDNHTGLMWEVKTDDGGLHDKDNTYQWYNSDVTTNGGFEGYINNGNNTQAFAKTVNAQGLCGHNDWRLPSKQELHSIVNYGKYDPAIDVNYFSYTQYNWSSSTVLGLDDNAWIVGFNDGGDYLNYKYDNLFVLLVRSSQ